MCVGEMARGAESVRGGERRACRGERECVCVRGEKV